MLVATSRLTRQGQISVPVEVRRLLGARAGTELVWELRDNGDFVVRPKRNTLADLEQLVGPIKVRLTDEDLKAARAAFLASRTSRD